jgi:hypothetical protein
MERPTHFQTAFYLSILSAVITFILLDIVFRVPAPDIYYFGLGPAIPFGLWVKSNFLRSLGAVYLVVVAGSLLWPVVSSNFVLDHLPLAALYIFLAGINLLIAGLLLLSKQFAIEWTKERDQQPKYKRYLRLGLLCGSLEQR